jgi:hypothetical protein
VVRTLSFVERPGCVNFVAAVVHDCTFVTKSQLVGVVGYGMRVYFIESAEERERG